MSLDAQLKEYVEANFSAPDASIYHYTHHKNVADIQRSGYLNFSSHRYLNNYNNRELKSGVEIIQRQLQKASLSSLIPTFNDYIDHGLEVYTASFCEEKRSKYAAKKYGNCCIEFKYNFLCQFKNPTTEIILGRVKYNREEQEAIIMDLIGLYENYPEKSDIQRVDLFLWLSIVIPLLKEQRDYRDKECRLVTAQVWGLNDQKLKTTPCAQKIEFNANDIAISSI